MAKKSFFPDDFESQLNWLNNFADQIPTYAAKYGISAAQLLAIAADRDWLGYWYGVHSAVQTLAQNITAFKNEAAFGVAAGSSPSVTPVITPPAAAPIPVAPGIFPRALSIANAIKVHKDYTLADGAALQLEGADIPPPDLATVRPALKLALAADHVDVGWKKQGTEGVEIWVKRGADDFAFLAVDTTTPKYVDTQPFPATEEKWTYKAIHIFGGGRVGLWSEEVSVMVKA